MNKTAIKNFAVWARNKLIADISYRAGLMGITESGIASALPQSTGTTEFYDIGTAEPYAISGEEVKQRERLVELIKQKEQDTDYKTAYDYVIEEVAYTWFNRLIAIRFMEVNDYLPSHVRVLSSESGKQEPDLVTTPFEAELELTQNEEKLIIQLKQDNKLDELFRILFIKQCNALNDILPELFEKTSDYTELLLNISFIDREGLIYHLLNDIDEADFDVKRSGQVEIIGWLYQYYISEKHDQIINIYKGTVKKEDIPAATQLFTTDWVVRYMVDNSLGRYWIERHPESNLVEKLDFFVKPQNRKIEYINEKIEPEEVTFFDPCMGSGHILVYAFDVLMEIYREVGYTDRDAAKSILENNIFGLDIDKRAYQLAYFSLLMKARSYNRRILSVGIEPNLCAFEESNGISKFVNNNISVDKKQNEIGEYLLEVFKHAKEIGSLQTVEPKEYNGFEEYLNACEVRGQMDLFSYNWIKQVLPLMKNLNKQAMILSRKYDVVCTNPPYMGKLEGKLKEFVGDSYKPYSGDLFSVFMYRNFAFCKKGGYSGFMTPFVWMFIKTYENLRTYIIDHKAITTLIQMEYSAYEEATVPICSFVLKNDAQSTSGLYFRLSDFKGGMDVQKEKVLDAIDNPECGYFYEAKKEDFNKVPGLPIAYWLSDTLRETFMKSKSLSEFGNPKVGLQTGDTNRFLRFWFETDINCTYIAKHQSRDEFKWFPICKGGEYRRWYGNNNYVVNWENDGFELRNFKDEKGKLKSRPQNIEYYFKKGITWNLISSSNFAVRCYPDGMIFDVSANAFFCSDDIYHYIAAVLNSKIIYVLSKVLNPTINFSAGVIANLPIMIDKEYMQIVDDIVAQNIKEEKLDWDAYETSWDFIKHPLAIGHTVKEAFSKWSTECDKRFSLLKANEIELNRIFIDVYGLKDELQPEVDDKDVTIHKADLQRDVKSLLSYAVGCMFGRYSLDDSGLIYAGGEWDSDKYSTFIPDRDNCIPITDEEYFEDDVVGLLGEWLKKVYGASTLEENLDFIASILGNKGKTSREVIRNYFMTDFIKDHIKTYQKRPIYWLFDSGKQNGFKALVYMHRWNADTIGNLRIDYLHRVQYIYESEINRMQDMIDHSANAREVAAATKRKEKLQKQLKECREYDEKIGHLALSRIDIDLDDGVKANYEKVQTASDGKKYQVLAKI